jgi:hypothetical protein
MSLRSGKNGVCIAATLPANFALSEWEQGRVFNVEFELRWHVHWDAVCLLLLAEQEAAPPLCTGLCTWQKSDISYDTASTKHMLVGTFYRGQDGEWFFAEASVPRAFNYPVDTDGLTNRDHAHAVLHGKHYRYGGRTVLTRFTHFSVERERNKRAER